MSTADANSLIEPPQSSDRLILGIVAAYASAFVAFGLIVDGPEAVMRGLIEIVSTRDALLTDYFGVGGKGAGCVNAGMLTLAACVIYYRCSAKMSGAAVACLFLVLGFGLFGKNLVNIWFIVFGVFLYCRFKGEPFATHINTAFFGTALAPIFSEIAFSTALPIEIGLPLGAVTATVIGFVLAPAAAQLFKAHMGFSLYNMGFTAGIIGVLVVALFKSFGFVPDPVMIWTSGYDRLLGAFLLAIFLSMSAIGFFLDRNAVAGVLRIVRESGQAPADFVSLAGFGAVLVNMSLTGAIGLGYVLLVGGDLNGPVIGAIFTIVGFAAYGKHPRNIWPIMVGVFLGSLIKPWSATDPSGLLAALFGTTLAPIAGRFGWHWGIVVGFLHSSAARSVGTVHAGLNLYNNGFAAGIVAAVMAAVIMSVQTRRNGQPK
jgi:Protein of unknown function (DUF1576)